MEDDEKVRYTFMLGIIFLVFLQSLPLVYPDLFKWIYLLTGLIVLLALLLFALDGIMLNIVPDKLAKLIAWVGVFLVALVVLIAFISEPQFLNIPLP